MDLTFNLFLILIKLIIKNKQHKIVLQVNFKNNKMFKFINVKNVIQFLTKFYENYLGI